jgi:hypothetical protein
MTSTYATGRITKDDAASGFCCGKHALDDYFARHAFKNDEAGVGRAYVLHRSDDDDVTLPAVFGFYTLSMAAVASEQAAAALKQKLPRYPMPVALIGRLAVDERARGGGRRLGERLLLDAFRRIVDAAGLLGCIGIIVDAKDADGEGFYAKYDFVAVTDEWPKRMFLAIGTARDALS